MEEENKVSEISIEKDEKLPKTYVVSIDNKLFLNVTVSESDVLDSRIREWVLGVQAIYGKKNRRNLIVGETPYDMLQLCVGTHCLVMELYSYCPLPRVFKDFLYDNKTVVVGVGIEKIATKLEKDRKDDRLIISRRVELREEAEKLFPGNKLEKCSLEELAKVVLRGEVNFVKPKKMTWSEVSAMGRDTHLTKELIKCASVEAFLACRMGSNLLK
ncbi:hypothetical protein like AT2G36110 [Hibiscus trionum]|uniref:Uncharacterized protein n=1 Tax=Hibiscus trionum TaxID=183268 RepID=A0A9W7HIU0_HIBTR|nr:hypothetical protein like AT2G36110 [Hibiscus trionum]